MTELKQEPTQEEVDQLKNDWEHFYKQKAEILEIIRRSDPDYEFDF